MTGLGKQDPVRLPSKKRRPLLDLALPAVAIGSGAMLFFAVPNILNATSYWDYAKAFTLALSATAVSYGINKLAIERGAPLGTTGYHGASALSIASILAVGGGLFAATFSGLSLKDAAELDLQEHGTALSVFIGTSSGSASKAGRVNPVIRSIEIDLQLKAACEIAVSCISGRGNGGNGTVARAVQEHAGRASSIGQQIVFGDAARQEIVAQMNADIGEYQKILGDDAEDIWDRRAKLQVVDTKIRQDVGELNEAVPISLFGAYASELQTGIGILDRPEAEARLNGILSRHGQSLASVLAGIDGVKSAPPEFPGRTGVSDTFRYIGHFLPIAAIAAVVELIFPLVLWAYTYWSLAWEKYRLQPPARDQDDEIGAQMASSSRLQSRHADNDNSGAKRRGRNGHTPLSHSTQDPHAHN